MISTTAQRGMLTDADTCAFVSVMNYTPSTASSSASTSALASSSRQPVASTSTAPDLGWIEVIPKAVAKKAKKDAKRASLASAVSAKEQLALDAEARKLAAKVRQLLTMRALVTRSLINIFPILCPSQKHRLLLLRTLQSHLIRDKSLSAVEKEMALQRALMGKGAKKRLARGGKEVEQEGDEQGDDEDEDERGGTKGEWKGRSFKWKAERRK
jgi:hypothetical protein